VGRPERALDPTAGVLQAFAHDLRLLRAAAGSPKYRALARAAGYSPSSLSAAAGGFALPTLAVTLAYVGACGGDLAGWERRWPELAAKVAAERDALPAAQGAAAQAPARHTVPRQLPMDVLGFTGRDGELADLDALLGAASRWASAVVISTLSGAGGVGKTALAVHWAHRVADRFPDGQLYVNLRGYDPDQPLDPADALAAVLRGLGVHGAEIPYGLDERAALYRSLVAGRRMLVLLDNAHVAAQVRPLLPGSPTCFVVVTSRDGLAGLVVRDGARRIDLDLLPLPDAVGLLAALIGDRVRDDPAGAAALAERCARLPLALRVAAELAAARPSVPLARLADDLVDQHRRLDLLDVGADEHTAVRAVFSWSYRHLPARDARVFALLGVHPGRDLEAYAVAALAGTGLAEARRCLARLAQAHLVQRAGTRRFGLHDLLRAYAAELAGGLGEGAGQVASDRILDHYLATAAAATDVLYPHDRAARPVVPAPVTPAPAFGDVAAARRWLDAERVNLVAAAGYAARNGRPAHATALARILPRYLDVGAHRGDAVELQRHALVAARAAGDRAAEASAEHHLGLVHARWGRYDESVAYFERALAVRREIGDRLGEAATMNNLGCIHGTWGRFGDALDLHLRTLVIRRETGDRSGEGATEGNIGQALWRMRRYDEAEAHLRRALAIHREMGHRIGEAYVLNTLGAVMSRRGRYAEALDLNRQTQAVFAELGYRAGEGYALDELATTHRLMGHHAEAVAQHQRALAIHRATGERFAEAETIGGLADAYRDWGRHAQATAAYRESIALASELGNRNLETIALNGLGEVDRAAGRPDDARAHHAAALDLARALDDEFEATRALANLRRLGVSPAALP
jgi:tetratricopeptide (TPR) repeat protein